MSLDYVTCFRFNWSLNTQNKVDWANAVRDKWFTGSIKQPWQLGQKCWYMPAELMYQEVNKTLQEASNVDQ